MKEFIDYIVKNKYIIICIGIVVVLYALGIVEFLSKLLILLALIALAVFVGKKLQDNDKSIKNFFQDLKNRFTNRNKTNSDNTVYYYQETKKSDKK